MSTFLVVALVLIIAILLFGAAFVRSVLMAVLGIIIGVAAIIYVASVEGLATLVIIGFWSLFGLACLGVVVDQFQKMVERDKRIKENRARRAAR